jgi:hypothetical protein
MVGKYIERLVLKEGEKEAGKNGGISREKLSSWGYGV